MRRRAAPGGLLSSAFALGAALLLAVILLAATSGDPGASLLAFFAGPFAGAYALGNMLERAALFLVAGVGCAVAFRGGAFNLGGEGQVYAGGFAGTAAALALGSAPGAIAMVAALAAGAAAGGLLGAGSGWLRKRWGVDELITSFLAANAVVPLIDYAISGPFRDPKGSLIATAPVPEGALLGSILPPSQLSLALPAAILIALAAWAFIAKSSAGYAYRVCGANPRFAAAGGLEPGRALARGMAFSGALCGLAGILAVLGVGQQACYRGFSAGMGWNGIAVALIARNSPAGAIPAAFVFAFIEQGSLAATLRTDFGLELGSIVQAAVFLLITARLGFLEGAALRLSAAIARIRGGGG